MKRRSKRRSQSGLTLVEMMISLLILSIAIGAVLTLSGTMMRGYHDNKRANEAERAARASLDIMIDAVRGASPGVPQGNVTDLVGCTAFGGITVVNNTNAPDELEVVYSSGGVLTSLSADFNDTDTTINVYDTTGFAVGDYVVVTNYTAGHILEVTGVDSGGLTLTTPNPSGVCGAANFPAGGYKQGELVVRARIARFYIDSSAAVGGIPTLMMDMDDDGPLEAEPLAQGVEDLQIAVGVDADEDGELFEDGSGTDEWHYNDSTDAAAPIITGSKWRALRLTVVGRTTTDATRYDTNYRPAIEDRAASTTADPYRRRILTATVEIRNMEGSP